MEEVVQNKENSLKTRNSLLQELIKTEKDYVNDLEIVVKNYVPKLLSCDCKHSLNLKNGHDKLIFGNITEIYKFHRDKFLKAVEKCLENPLEVASAIKRNKNIFKLYSVYCRNKPNSEFVIQKNADYFEALRIKLNQNLTISDFLIKPIQRLTKYELLLSQIVEKTKNAGKEYQAQANGLQEALNIIKQVLQYVNNMMEASFIQGFNENLGAYGELYYIDTMLCEKSEDQSSPNVMRMFLFRQIVIFVEFIEEFKPFSSPKYLYKDSILINNIDIEEVEDKRKFLVQSKRDKVAFVCETESDEIYDKWFKKITDLREERRNWCKSFCFN